MALRDTILAKDDIEVEQVEVKQWQVTVEVRGMTGRERARLVSAAMEEEKVNFERVYPDLVIASAFDPATGEQVFRPDDRDALMSKSGAAIETLARVAMRLSGLAKEAEKSLGEASSTPATNDGSTSS